MFELSPYHLDDRLFFAGAALLANAALASHALLNILRLHAPGRYLRHLLLSLERRLNRAHRKASDRAIRGFVVVASMVLLTSFVAMQLSALSATHYLGWAGEAILLALFIPQRTCYDRTRNLAKAIDTKDLPQARKLARALSARETANLDTHALIRTAIEHLASSLSERVISPLFWYIFFGLPGFITAKIVIETGLLFGYPSRRHRAYGLAARRLQSLFTCIPTLWSGILLLLASYFVPKAHPLQAMRLLRNESSKIMAPGKGSLIAISAGALGISLGGPKSVQNYLVQDGWVGTGSAKVKPTDLRRMQVLYATACLINVIAIAVLLIVMG